MCIGSQINRLSTQGKNEPRFFLHTFLIFQFIFKTFFLIIIPKIISEILTRTLKCFRSVICWVFQRCSQVIPTRFTLRTFSNGRSRTDLTPFGVNLGQVVGSLREKQARSLQFLKKARFRTSTVSLYSIDSIHQISYLWDQFRENLEKFDT